MGKAERLAGDLERARERREKLFAIRRGGETHQIILVTSEKQVNKRELFHCALGMGFEEGESGDGFSCRGRRRRE